MSHCILYIHLKHCSLCERAAASVCSRLHRAAVDVLGNPGHQLCSVLSPPTKTFQCECDAAERTSVIICSFKGVGEVMMLHSSVAQADELIRVWTQSFVRLMGLLLLGAFSWDLLAVK